MAIVERIRVHYRHQIEYDNPDTNKIGATDTLDIALRQITAPAVGTTNYVRKFGNDYLITQVTDITDPVDANMTFTVRAADGTVLGSFIGGAAFVPGAVLAVAQACYLEISCLVAPVVVLAVITIDTDVDAGGLAFTCAAETIQIGDTLTLYLSDTSSTYYDINYMYGGGRHTPAVGDPRLPYFHPEAADTALGGARLIVHVLDSATYEVEDYAISLAATIWQCAMGQKARLTAGTGARVTREMVNPDGNNLDTAYVSGLLALGGIGTYQDPYTTIAAAIAGIGARANIHIMDSNVYTENLTIAADIDLEPLYSEMPLLGGGIIFQHIAASVYGLQANPNSSGVIFQLFILNYAGTIEDNTIHGGGIGINCGNFDMNNPALNKNIIYNCSSGISLGLQTPTTITAQGNIIKNNINGIQLELTGLARTQTLNANDNLIYDNSGSGIYIEIDENFAHTLGGDIKNNTIYNNDYGIRYNVTTPGAATAHNEVYSDNIVYDNTTTDLAKNLAPAIIITESNYGTKDAQWTAGGTNIITDPEFCDTTLPYKLGISADSGAYRTGTGSDDMGAHLRMIEINESDITLNGFFIDGAEQYFNAVYIADGVDHTGTIINWVDWYDFNGIGIDPYDDDVDTDCIITHNRAYRNGNALKLSRGGNTVEYNVMFGNTIFNIWSDYMGQSFVHNSIYGNQYGLYLESNSGGITFRDNITHQNTSYGIYSEVNIIATYCDITDATNNVDATDASNFTDNPLFIDVDAGEENFRLKSIANENSVNSPCIGESSTDIDIGAWQVDRSVDEDYWRLYDFSFQPKVTWDNIGKGAVQFNDATGGLDNWARAHKRMFSFDMSAPQVSNAEQRKTFEYWTTLIRKRESATVDSETIFRLHFLPTTYLSPITSGTVDADGPTILDATQSWIYNEWKGFHVGVIYESGIGTGEFAAIAKTMAVVPDPVWIVDEWIGYYVYHFGYYYYILSNTTDTLTLSDPLGTLENELLADWAIEKYFKIQSNNATTLCVLDPNSELVSGTYDYYIDFIECKIQSVNFKYSQPRYLYGREHSKVGYSIVFEES